MLEENGEANLLLLFLLYYGFEEGKGIIVSPRKLDARGDLEMMMMNN